MVWLPDSPEVEVLQDWLVPLELAKQLHSVLAAAVAAQRSAHWRPLRDQKLAQQQAQQREWG
jgi:hypothetical protein